MINTPSDHKRRGILSGNVKVNIRESYKTLWYLKDCKKIRKMGIQVQFPNPNFHRAFNVILPKGSIVNKLLVIPHVQERDNEEFGPGVNLPVEYEVVSKKGRCKVYSLTELKGKIIRILRITEKTNVKNK